MSEKVLILSFSDLSVDARVNRQIDFFLKLKKEVTVIAFNPPKTPIKNFIKISLPSRSFFNKVKMFFYLIFRKYEKIYFEKPEVKEILSLNLNHFDLVIANDIETLPIAIKIKKNAILLFDAHEYAPKQFESNFYWKLTRQAFKSYLSKKYIKEAHMVTTVSEPIARQYQEFCSIKKPTVITNAPGFRNLAPSKVNSQKIRLVHHGFCDQTRKIEDMISLFFLLEDRFALDFFLLSNNKKYLDRLKRLASKNNRIRFLEPVPFSKLPEALNSYDIGLYLQPKSSFNALNSLPNKFFDFIQARLALAISPSLQMADLIKKYNNGRVSADFSKESFAKMLNDLKVEEIEVMKNNSNLAAKELSELSNFKKMKELLAENGS